MTEPAEGRRECWPFPSKRIMDFTSRCRKQAFSILTAFPRSSSVPKYARARIWSFQGVWMEKKKLPNKKWPLLPGRKNPEVWGSLFPVLDQEVCMPNWSLAAGGDWLHYKEATTVSCWCLTCKSCRSERTLCRGRLCCVGRHGWVGEEEEEEAACIDGTRALRAAVCRCKRVKTQSSESELFLG